MNNHVINLIKGHQLAYTLIYSLRPVELETLKTNNKTNLANKFIWPFKSPIDTPIFFIKKLDRSL